MQFNPSVTSLQAITLDMTIRSGGELLMAPTIVVPFGEPGIVTVVNDDHNGLSLEVLSTKDDEEGSAICIQCELSEIKNSAKRTLIKPKFITTVGEEAVISVGSGEHQLSISVTPSYSDALSGLKS